MITPLPFGKGTGEGPLTYRGISVITPLPLGEGKGEGPAREGGGASCCWGRAQLLLVREVIPTKRLIKGEKTLINVCKYYQK